MKKLLFFVAIFVVLTGSVAFLWLHRVTKQIFVNPSGKNQTQSLPTSLSGYFSGDLPFNILVAGYGGGNHDGAYLTDTMIVVHVDPKNQKVFLVSVPRDIWVKIPTDGKNGKYWKLNAAYPLGMDDTGYPNKLPQFTGEDGAGRLSEYMVGQVTGLTIPYFVGLDFSGFTHSIDTLGGVDINVNPAFTDPEYPIEGKEADLCGHTPDQIPALDELAATTSAELAYPCRYETLHFDAGLQHMDGSAALKYVRSRHSLTDGTDFGRAERQRKLLVAVKQKVMSMGFLPKVIPFMSSLGGDVKTDLSPNDVKTLIQHATELNGYSVETLALTDQNYLIDTFSNDGQAILSPKDGQDNWQSVHTWLANTFAGLPVPALPIIQVENGTKAPGLAQYASDELKTLHFQVREPASAPNPATKTSVVVYDPTIPQSDIKTLEKTFNTSITLEKQATPSAYNVLVTLGPDYQPMPSVTPTP